MNKDYSGNLSITFYKQIIKRLLKKDNSPSFYQKYPKLFHSYYPDISDKEVIKLSDAGYLYYHSLLGLDSLIDDNDNSNISNIIQLQEESIKLLTDIYGAESSFWFVWNKRKKEYFEAAQTEKNLKKIDNKVDWSLYETISDNKSAFGKIAIDCLYILSKQQNQGIYENLLKSHKYFSVGFQLYDDLKDFKEDIEKGQFNWAVEESKKEIDFNSLKNDFVTINKLLYIKGIGQRVLKESIKNFDKALRILQNIGVESEWLATVYDMKETIEHYLDITDGYIETIRVRLSLKDTKINSHLFFNFSNIPNGTVKRGLDFIKSDFEQNYVVLKHIMYLGILEGFKNKATVHISDIFQRALLNDCLISVSNKYNIDISNFLKDECEYLIGKKNKDSVAAWSYFPTVHEISADIDDLGQIIQLFIKSRNRILVKKHCNKAIDVALEQRSLSNGGIETWIIPVINQTEAQKRQEFFNNTKWGKGPDVEVVANFIYALFIYDKEMYKTQIEKSLKFIIKQQNIKGFWESRWYYGNYYGSFICLKLLKEFEKEFTKEIQKTLDYFLCCQNSNGGFSLNIERESDPLSTSLAILCLKLFFNNSHESIVKAVDYLISCQNDDGSWDAVDFIRPKINEPYKSKTLTTSLVIKSLCE